MRVLVTGVAGFLGRHFAAALDAAGHEVCGVDIAPAPGVVVRDVRDLFRHDQTRYDLVVHCAAVSPHLGAITRRPVTMAAGCAELDAGLWSWAERTRPGRVVYFSSCAAYPARPAEWGPMSEDDIDIYTANRDTYGWVKLCGERMASIYASSRWPESRVTVVRPFSGYGSGQGTEWPFGAFIDRASRREDPFVVWGSGEQVRDWVHVDDIVGAVLAAVDQGVAGPVNVGTGRATTLNELAALVCAAAGYGPEFDHRLSAPTGPVYRVANIGRLTEFYVPRVSLEEGVARALA